MSKKKSPRSDPHNSYWDRFLLGMNVVDPETSFDTEIVSQVKSIYEVLEGKKDFTEWFAEVRQALSLKSYQLAKILYDSLEGLKSREARDLREQWYDFIVAEMRGYGVS